MSKPTSCVNGILYGMFLNSSHNSKKGWKRDVSQAIILKKDGKKKKNECLESLRVDLEKNVSKISLNTFIQKSCKLRSSRITVHKYI